MGLNKKLVLMAYDVGHDAYPRGGEHPRGGELGVPYKNSCVDVNSRRARCGQALQIMARIFIAGLIIIHY